MYPDGSDPALARSPPLLDTTPTRIGSVQSSVKSKS
jgi:hypothetical protein